MAHSVFLTKGKGHTHSHTHTHRNQGRTRSFAQRVEGTLPYILTHIELRVALILSHKGERAHSLTFLVTQSEGHMMGALCLSQEGERAHSLTYSHTQS